MSTSGEYRYARLADIRFDDLDDLDSVDSHESHDNYSNYDTINSVNSIKNINSFNNFNSERKSCIFSCWLDDRLQTFRLPPAEDCPDWRPGDVLLLHFRAQELIEASFVDRPQSGAEANPDILRWRKPLKPEIESTESSGSGKTRMCVLRERARYKAGLRAWFRSKDFLEVDLPVHVSAPNPEIHLQHLATEKGVLSTSPEMQMKRMLIGGFEKLYSIGPCFRGGKADATHNSEFMMVEWYRPGDRLEVLAADLEDMIISLVRGREAVGPTLSRQPTQPTLQLPDPPWPRLSLFNLFQENFSINLGACSDSRELFRQGRSAGFLEDADPDERYEQIFTRLWLQLWPLLDHETPFFLYDWPAPLASQAALDAEEPAKALRMELFIHGLELANGFVELRAGAAYRKRFREEMQLRRELGLPEFAVDEKFLGAMDAGLPPSLGMAMGFDRLVMLLSGCADIKSVLSFAHDEL